MKRIVLVALLFAGFSILRCTLPAPLLAAEIPAEVGALSKLLNPGGYFEVRPGAGVRYDEATLKAIPQWWVGGKVVASPRKWLGVEAVVQFDVPGHSKPRAEASTFVRF